MLIGLKVMELKIYFMKQPTKTFSPKDIDKGIRDRRKDNQSFM